MSERLKELRDKQQEVLTEARSLMDQAGEAEDEARASELEASADKAMAKFDELEKKAKREEQAIERENKMLEAEEQLRDIDRSRRPVDDDSATQDRAASAEKVDPKEAHRAAFRNFLAYGMDGLGPDERKLMTSKAGELRQLLGEGEARAQGVGSSASGGALVPEGFMAELIVSLKDYGPMMDPGVVRQIVTATGNAMPWPTMDDTNNVGRLLAENTQVTATDITFGTKQLDAYKYSSDLILVSAELLQDSALDTEAIVRNAMAERIGRILNQHMTTGTGSSQPNGVVTAATAGVTAAANNAITGDELIDLEHSVDPAYRRAANVKWMFNDTTLKVIRKLKDGDGNYLWQMGDVRVGAPATLLGHPYEINQDMASIGDASPDGDNRVILFGDFSKYVARMVRMFAVRRLTERYADYDQVGFVGFTRADGELVDTAAIKYLNMGT